jgi:hypothetical protein
MYDEFPVSGESNIQVNGMNQMNMMQNYGNMQGMRISETPRNMSGGMNPQFLSPQNRYSNAPQFQFENEGMGQGIGGGGFNTHRPLAGGGYNQISMPNLRSPPVTSIQGLYAQANQKQQNQQQELLQMKQQVRDLINQKSFQVNFFS